MIYIDDLVLLAAWCLFALLTAQLTRHLYDDLGVLVGSQALVMTLAALSYTIIARAGVDAWMGLASALVLGGIIGVLHVPILLQVGPYLILVVTAVGQIVLIYFWLLMPGLTGGSGGLLLPQGQAVLEGVTAAIALVFVYLFMRYFVRKPGRYFDYACIRELGVKASALGVPARGLYAVGFLLYGVALGACGVAAVRLLGFLTHDLFGLSWTLTSILIVLIGRGRSDAVVVVLAILYAIVRVGVRQIVGASPFWAHGIEVFFPLLLLAFFAANIRLKRGRAL